MKLHEINLIPRSGFGTPLKGDTLFGHLCWQAAYDENLLGTPLKELLGNYEQKPFAVISSAAIKLEDGHAFKRPDMPLSLLQPVDTADRVEKMQRIKEKKGEKWMRVESIGALDFGAVSFYGDEALARHMGRSPHGKSVTGAGRDAAHKSIVTHHPHPHNTINRLSQSTGTGGFAPFQHDNFYYHPAALLAVFVLIDDTVTHIERVLEGVRRIGEWGFGRDASIGMGRFTVDGHREIPLPDPAGANGCYTLGPCVPEKGSCSRRFFIPFTRFGKHGDVMAVGGNPFKNPVVMADEGAVFIPDDPGLFEKPYLGRAVINVSKQEPGAVHQGYAPFLPVKLNLEAVS